MSGDSCSSCADLVSYRLATFADGKDCRIFAHSRANKIGRLSAGRMLNSCGVKIDLSQNLIKREHNQVPAVAKALTKHCANAIAVFIAERS